jgi:RNA polymerase sigma-70 factor (ECF subfamily)
LLETEWTLANAVQEIFETTDIRDDRLRMMFSCCQNALAETAQVMLVLALAGGFGVREIAAAFVSSHAAVEKRLTRAKHALKESGPLFDIADRADFEQRLPAVQRALYLIFSEGYHGASPRAAVRTDLCHEAIRLTGLLAKHPLGAVPSTHALLALMYLDAARLPARLDPAGNLTSLFDQDRSRWNRAMIQEGVAWLERSATGPAMTRYHVEAAIAAVHARAPSVEETDWSAIVGLYDTLTRIVPSPIVALNRAVAIAQRDGPDAGLAAIETMHGREKLEEYPFFHAARAELELRRGNHVAARGHFTIAITVARNPEERRFYENRRARCERPAPV